MGPHTCAGAGVAAQVLTTGRPPPHRLVREGLAGGGVEKVVKGACTLDHSKSREKSAKIAVFLRF